MARSANRPRLGRTWAWAKSEPLVLFLALGMALFLLFGLLNPDAMSENSRTIAVDREKLSSFLGSRQVSVDDGHSSPLDRMSATDIQALVDEYVREEVMYREAHELGLDEGDFYIRRRLAQSLDFLLRNASMTAQPSEADVREYYEKNPERYASPPTITFSHVYFSDFPQGPAEGLSRAKSLLAQINTRGEQSDFANGWPGDRFAYHLNYVDRDKDMVASHFGKDMAGKLFNMPPDEGTWQGPVRSENGTHLVRIDRMSSAERPAFAAIAGQVRKDLMEARKDQTSAEAYKRMREDFKVVVAGDIERMLTAK